ncbi:MAG: sugar ABC transporter ATP-binding protein [Sedimentisphaerales bacterium]|nr:sugar ABC transporter ATP-binding protein [Sedimentisphaerales bacterium]
MNQIRPVILELRGIGKSFGPVRAVDAVVLRLQGGQVHALVGENGAGKSTLSKIMAGMLAPDGGQMMLDAKPYAPSNRNEAEQSGIRIVTQEFNLISTLTVAENIFFNDLPRSCGVIRYSTLNEKASRLLQQIGLDFIHPTSRAGDLPVGSQQLVEIASGLSRQCRLLILDEPTASLTDKETELLFSQIKALCRQGAAVVYISHRMEEIRRIADVVTILRDGRVVCTDTMDSLTTGEIVNRMVGRDWSDEYRRTTPETGPVALRVEHLSVGKKVRDISFVAHRGEILGFAGLMGAGRTEAMRAIFGADPIDSGRIYLHGSQRPSRIASPKDAVRHGIALLTENRKEEGLLLIKSIRSNCTLASMEKFSTAGYVRSAREKKHVGGLADRLRLRCWNTEQAAWELSGGNQQKLVVAKWLSTECDILIFDEPTRGIDVGAKFELYHLLSDLARRQKAILVVSSDLKELMLLCDRIAVMSAGRLVEVFDRKPFDEAAINRAAFREYVHPVHSQEHERNA